MTTWQLAIALLVDLAVVATLIGLVVRGRWRLCVAFVPYLLVVLTFNLSVLLWPDRFFKVWFWIGAHGLLDAMKTGIVLELAWRVFHRGGRPLPGGRLVVALAAGAAVFGSVSFLVAGPGYTAALRDGLWWCLKGAGWMLLAALATLGIGKWRRSVDPFQTALLAGLAGYLFLYSSWRQWFSRPWEVSPVLVATEPMAYLALVCFWAYMAARPQPRPRPSGPRALPAGTVSGPESRLRGPRPRHELALSP